MHRKCDMVMMLNTHAQKEQHAYDAEHECTERTTCIVMMLSLQKRRKNHMFMILKTHAQKEPNHMFMILNTHVQKVCTTHPTVLSTDIVIIQ